MKINWKLVGVAFLIAFVLSFSSIMMQFANVANGSDMFAFLFGSTVTLAIFTVIISIVLAILMIVLKKLGIIKAKKK